MGIIQYFSERKKERDQTRYAGLLARKDCLTRLLQMDGEKPAYWADELVDVEQKLGELRHTLQK